MNRYGDRGPLERLRLAVSFSVGLVGWAVLGSCAERPADLSSCGPDLEAPRAVENAGAGLWEARDQRRAELEELWRTGGLREGEGLVLPIGISTGPTGRIAVTDFRLGEVLVIGSGGEWLGSWTRRGDGPGEVLRPVATTWTADERLVVFDIEGARIVWLDGPGESARQVRLDPSFSAPVVASGAFLGAAVGPEGTAYLRPRPSTIASEPRAIDVLTRYRPDVGVADTVRVDTISTLAASGRLAAHGTPGAPDLSFALAPGGRLMVGDTEDGYRLLELGSALIPARAICRASAPAEPDAGLAAFDRFFVGAEGRIWVQRDHPSPSDPSGFIGAPGAEYDVFSPEGRYLGSVTAPERARLQAARGDTVWGLEFGELDEVSIVAYELSLTSVSRSSESRSTRSTTR